MEDGTEGQERAVAHVVVSGADGGWAGQQEGGVSSKLFLEHPLGGSHRAGWGKKRAGWISPPGESGRGGFSRRAAGPNWNPKTAQKVKTSWVEIFSAEIWIKKNKYGCEPPPALKKKTNLSGLMDSFGHLHCPCTARKAL